MRGDSRGNSLGALIAAGLGIVALGAAREYGRPKPPPRVGRGPSTSGPSESVPGETGGGEWTPPRLPVGRGFYGRASGGASILCWQHKKGSEFLLLGYADDRDISQSNAPKTTGFITAPIVVWGVLGGQQIIYNPLDDPLYWGGQGDRPPFLPPEFEPRRGHSLAIRPDEIRATINEPGYYCIPNAFLKYWLTKGEWPSGIPKIVNRVLLDTVARGNPETLASLHNSMLLCAQSDANIALPRYRSKLMLLRSTGWTIFWSYVYETFYTGKVAPVWGMLAVDAEV